MGNIEDRDTAYIWLRQTAELTLGDQRRTLEIAVPVRAGATPEEVSRLLDEAEAGMERLAERMDRQVAALHASSPAATTSTAPAARPTAPARPANGIAERPVAPPRPAPAPSPTPAPSPARSAAPSSAPPPASTSTSGPMSRAEFLEQARGLGQSPRQAMDRLGVRTLEGLNYAEALEQIKRQLLRESTQAPHGAAPAAPAAPESLPATEEAHEPVAPRGPVSYFDEEDDYDVSFELPEDGAAADPDLDASEVAMDSTARPGPAVAAEPVDLDLEDVPDFVEPRPAARGEPTARPRAAATSPTAGAIAGAIGDAAASSRPAPPTSHQALAQRARAHDLLARLREYRGGGPAGSDQITPFTNVVIQQLGEPTVESLTEQVWGLAPAQLAAPQMRALIQWGKTDAFATEVVAVLELLAAEHATETTAEAKEPASRPGRTAARTAGRGSGSAH